jgi:hypothetical protein
MIARIVLLLTIAPAAAFAQTEAICPWFTTGSAVKILGGDVTLVAHASGNWDGSCRFSRGSGEAAQSIDILIGKLDTHPCPPGSAKVPALGNEAVQCGRSKANGEEANTIAGRVRDAYFVVTMTNVPDATRREPADARLSGPYGASALLKVAEQVAGNLF